MRVQVFRQVTSKLDYFLGALSSFPKCMNDKCDLVGQLDTFFRSRRMMTYEVG